MLFTGSIGISRAIFMEREPFCIFANLRDQPRPSRAVGDGDWLGRFVSPNNSDRASQCREKQGNREIWIECSIRSYCGAHLLVRHEQNPILLELPYPAIAVRGVG